VTNLLQAFMDDSDGCVAQIENAIATRDAQQLSRLAHTQKSRTANLGAEALSGLYRQLETLGREGRIEAAGALIGDLKSVHRQVLARARDLLRKAA
jgi:HPt (histidine-containing phosphotransfer) domain-containing protein